MRLGKREKFASREEDPGPGVITDENFERPPEYTVASTINLEFDFSHGFEHSVDFAKVGFDICVCGNVLEYCEREDEIELLLFKHR